MDVRFQLEFRHIDVRISKNDNQLEDVMVDMVR